MAACSAWFSSSRGASGDTSGYGWTPADFQAAYNLPSSSKGSGQLVAIVDSYDNPDVASDLTTYRTKFGLGSVKFHKYNEKGQQKNYPEGSPDWGVEIDLDVQMVSAACPKCSIDLVEASSESSADMEKAEATAVKLGAHIVSNSWICYSYSCTLDPHYFDTKGVEYTAGAGDASYGLIGPPSTFATVVAVGGTVLSLSGSRYSETVWDGAGSGCASEMKNLRGSTIRAARLAPTPTSPPWRKTSPSTTPSAPAAGLRSPARVWPRR